MFCRIYISQKIYNKNNLKILEIVLTYEYKDVIIIKSRGSAGIGRQARLRI